MWLLPVDSILLQRNPSRPAQYFRSFQRNVPSSRVTHADCHPGSRDAGRRSGVDDLASNHASLTYFRTSSLPFTHNNYIHRKHGSKPRSKLTILSSVLIRTRPPATLPPAPSRERERSAQQLIWQTSAWHRFPHASHSQQQKIARSQDPEVRMKNEPMYSMRGNIRHISTAGQRLVHQVS